MNPESTVRTLADFVIASTSQIDDLVAGGHFVAALLLARLRIRAASCAFLISEAEFADRAGVIHTQRPQEKAQSVGNPVGLRLFRLDPLPAVPAFGPASGEAAPGREGFTC